MRWEGPVVVVLIAITWMPIVGFISVLGGSMNREKQERRESEQRQFDLDQTTQHRRAAFVNKLGFDPENGGRRFGEIVVQELQETPDKVLLYIPGSIVSIEQVRQIRNIITHRQEASNAETSESGK
jgi:hypothetical protein